MADKSIKNEVYVQFAKLQRAEDAKKATSEYEATAAALRAKTERLRALRLERDAAAPAAPKRKSRPRAMAPACWIFWTDRPRKAAMAEAAPFAGLTASFDLVSLMRAILMPRDVAIAAVQHLLLDVLGVVAGPEVFRRA